MECGRKLGTYLRKRQKMEREAARRDVFGRYIGEISKAVNAINGTDAKKLYEALLAEARKRTAVADAQLDEEGKTIRQKKDETDELKNDEGVVMVESRAAHLAPPEEPGAAAAEAPAANGDDGDLVKLGGKKKAKKKPSSNGDGLF
jgi:DNA topoisomerase-6 subunit B